MELLLIFQQITILVRYNGDVCRLSVQDYNNVQLISNIMPNIIR